MPELGDGEKVIWYAQKQGDDHLARCEVNGFEMELSFYAGNASAANVIVSNL